MTWLSVDLPEPFGPMMACTSPLFTVSESPWRISFSSTRTCRFLTSSSGITYFRFSSAFLVLRSAEGASRRTCPTIFFPFSSFETAAVRPPQDEASSNRTFQTDRNQLLRLNREFHRQLLQHVFHETVDHEADGLFLRQPALHAIEQHVLGNLRRGRFMLEQRRRILGLDIGHGMGAAFIADQQRVAGGEVARTGRLAMGGDEAAIGVL